MSVVFEWIFSKIKWVSFSVIVPTVVWVVTLQLKVEDSESRHLKAEASIGKLNDKIDRVQGETTLMFMEVQRSLGRIEGAVTRKRNQKNE